MACGLCDSDRPKNEHMEEAADAIVSYWPNEYKVHVVLPMTNCLRAAMCLVSNCLDNNTNTM